MVEGTKPGGGRRYLPRIADGQLATLLASSGAVLIEGPKACGKTFTAEQQAASSVFLDVDAQATELLALEPGLVLSGQPPQLIDEWQSAAAQVWNYVRKAVDTRSKPGQFILTGSAVPTDDVSRHSGAGRFARMRMRPMSLFESGASTGAVSLRTLLDGDDPPAALTETSVVDNISAALRGGWPLNIALTTPQAIRANRDYLRTIVDVDIARVDPARTDPTLAMRLLQGLARNVSQDYKVSRVVAATTPEDSGPTPARSTAYDYLRVFDRLLITEMQPAWSTHLRSRATIRTAPRTHFVDPSLAAAALGASPESLLRDLRYFGLLFESLVIRDLRIYSESLDATVSHYRDSDGLEVDAIIATPNAWGAFEVKLGTDAVDHAAKSLLAFAEKLDTTHVGAPAVLGVITGTGYSYRRADGVVVLPIGALGP